MLSLLIFMLVSLPFGQFFELSDARIYTLEMHHRFSEPVKMWSRESGNGVQKWPDEGSVEYYEELAKHDHLLRGRHLSEYEGPLTFSDGNSTFRISSLGFLHYTTVALGTPGVKFMVALDTGSDLFWVPCECGRCASIDDAFHSQDFELSIYSPNASLTSKEVMCSNNLCTHHTTCLDTFSQCPYSISYVSSETSTSGILVEDVLHLKSEHDHEGSLEAFITFGCGQVQTGSFLDVAAPNGLFGLGFEKISVPSILYQKGYTANSFSMCFGHDGSGRINFGDKVSLDQEETTFNVDSQHPTYNISVTQIQVGAALIDSEFTALFDSGTSFTYLVEPTYSRILENFHSQAQDKRHQTDARIPFEYCYDMSSDANTSLIPSVSLTMKGGSQFTVYDPVIVISTQHQFIYCLAVVKSEDYSIIGQNFMTGYRIVFDREKLMLGWKSSTVSYTLANYQSFSVTFALRINLSLGLCIRKRVCIRLTGYDIEESTAAKSQNSTSVPPAVAVGIGSNSSVLGNNTSEKSIASFYISLICVYLSIIFLAAVFL